MSFTESNTQSIEWAKSVQGHFNFSVDDFDGILVSSRALIQAAEGDLLPGCFEEGMHAYNVCYFQVLSAKAICKNSPEVSLQHFSAKLAALQSVQMLSMWFIDHGFSTETNEVQTNTAPHLH